MTSEDEIKHLNRQIYAFEQEKGKMLAFVKENEVLRAEIDAQLLKIDEKDLIIDKLTKEHEIIKGQLENMEHVMNLNGTISADEDEEKDDLPEIKIQTEDVVDPSPMNTGLARRDELSPTFQEGQEINNEKLFMQFPDE